MEQTFLDSLRKRLQEAVASGLENLPEPMQFYSVGCPGLIISVSKGKMHTDPGGFRTREGEKIVEFNPNAGGIKQEDGTIKHYGNTLVTDPEIALSLLERGYFSNKRDVILGQDFVVLATPKEILVKQERERRIEAENALQTYLRMNESKDEEVAALQRQLKAANDRLAAAGVMKDAETPQSNEGETASKGSSRAGSSKHEKVGAGA